MALNFHVAMWVIYLTSTCIYIISIYCAGCLLVAGAVVVSLVVFLLWTCGGRLVASSSGGVGRWLRFLCISSLLIHRWAVNLSGSLKKICMKK
jgi:hypothetical protein